MRARWVVVLLAAAAVWATAACSAGADQARETPSHRASVDVTAAATLEFTARTADGETFRGRGLAGKPALLWFWAPWCPTCRAQQPSVSALAEKHRGELSVVGVGGLDSTSAIEAYADEVRGFPQLVDKKGTVWRHFGITAQSSYVLLDANADIVAEGYLDDAEVAARVAHLIE